MGKRLPVSNSPQGWIPLLDTVARTRASSSTPQGGPRVAALTGETSTVAL
jgi:hypothetical protein